MDIGIEKNLGSTTDKIVLPNVKPNTSNDWDRDHSALKPTQDDLGRPRYLEFSQLSKIYPTPDGNSSVKVVDGFDLKMKKGEFISIIGHSGCGKSTVLSMTAGLNSVSEGVIILDNKEIASAGPDRGVVFQAPSLFPWLTAFENVMLGVDKVYPHAAKSERDDIVEYYLTRVGLGDSLRKKAGDMSNGMKQRVGIARAFALSPKLLLLDEPFGMLDSLTRWELQEVLMEVWERTHVTAIVVTHDVDEAILLADRVVMMTNGPHAKIGKIEDDRFAKTAQPQSPAGTSRLLQIPGEHLELSDRMRPYALDINNPRTACRMGRAIAKPIRVTKYVMGFTSCSIESLRSTHPTYFFVSFVPSW